MPDVQRITPHSEVEAMYLMLDGLGYFLVHHRKKTVIALILIFGIGGYLLRDYISSDKTRLSWTLYTG